MGFGQDAHPLFPRFSMPRLNMQRPRLIVDPHRALVLVTFDYKQYDPLPGQPADSGRIEPISAHDVTRDFMALLMGLADADDPRKVLSKAIIGGRG